MLYAVWRARYFLAIINIRLSFSGSLTLFLSKSESCDFVISVFAPVCPEEINRILKRDAVFIRVYPFEKHLLSLKKLIYENIILNTLPDEKMEGLKLTESHTIKDIIHLESNYDILNLFMMTPYYY